MSFQDLDEYLDPTLRLPIAGKTYVVQSPPARVGLRVNALVAVSRAAAANRQVSTSDLAALSLDDEEEHDFYRDLLGPTMDEMLADSVDWHRVKHAALTTMFWVARGRSAAESFWTGGGDNPKAPAVRSKKRKRKKQRTREARPASPASSTPQPPPASPGPTSSASTGT